MPFRKGPERFRHRQNHSFFPLRPVGERQQGQEQVSGQQQVQEPVWEQQQGQEPVSARQQGQDVPAEEASEAESALIELINMLRC